MGGAAPRHGSFRAAQPAIPSIEDFAKMQPFVVPLVLLAIVVVAALVGNYVARSFRMPDTGWLRRRYSASPKAAGQVIIHTGASPWVVTASG